MTLQPPAEKTTHIDWQLERFAEGAELPVLIWNDQAITYADLTARLQWWLETLMDFGISRGDSVAVVGDYSPAAISCLLALLRLNCVLVPLSWDSRDQHIEFFKVSEIDHLIEIDSQDEIQITAMDLRRNHSLLEQIRKANKPGLVLFSSGSTGEPKAILHDLSLILKKFRIARHSYRTINFLLFDHIGGFNTLFYTLANLGCIVVPTDRSADSVAKAIEKHRVELLPTSPSFLNLLLLTNAHRNYDLSSLKLITYGTEVMPDRTLELANEAFPNVRFLQTYGLSELGILRSKSAANDSLYVKVGGEDYETKVVNGTLWIRASSSMIG